MKSAPLHPEEARRLSVLEEFEVLDSEAESAFDELATIASAICGTPISLISLVDRDRQWFKSRVGLGAAETPREFAFCSHAILQDGVFEISNALQDHRFSDNPLVTGDPNIRFYAGAPLISASGLPLGTLCVIDREPRKLTEVQANALNALSRQVVGQLELRSHARKLERLNSAREKVFSVIGHDLRSPFNSILGFARTLAAKADRIEPKEVESMARYILSSSLNVYQLLDELLQWSQQQLGAYSSKLARHDIRELVESDLELIDDALNLKDLFIKVQAPEKIKVLADATLAKTVIRNLVANAVKYSPEHGEILIAVTELADDVQVSVQNSGAPMPKELRDMLFQGPVESGLGTKGETGHGIGLGLCYEFMKMQGGRIWLDESYAEGTRIFFSLPKG